MGIKNVGLHTLNSAPDGASAWIRTPSTLPPEEVYPRCSRGSMGLSLGHKEEKKRNIDALAGNRTLVVQSSLA
jgi:hypothetical protein